MPYFKDSNNKLHFLSTEDIAHGGKKYLPIGSKQITDAAAEALQAASVVAPTAQEQIRTIEATITPRRLREAVLTAEGKTWLEAADAQIAALRATIV
jgi:hypothetical protein